MKKVSDYSFLLSDDDGGGEEECPSPQKKKKIRLPNLLSVLGSRKVITASSSSSSSLFSSSSPSFFSSSTTPCPSVSPSLSSSSPSLNSSVGSSSSSFSSLSFSIANNYKQQQPLPPSSPAVDSSSGALSSSSSFTSSGLLCPSSSFSFRKVILSKLEKKFKDRSKTNRYKLFWEIKEQLFTTIFVTQRMDDCDAKEFLDYAMRDLDNTAVGNEKRQQQAQEDIFNEQLKSLSLVERNQLYRLLTHEKPQGDDDGGYWSLNEDMLGLFPFLRKRSSVLLNNMRDGRKTREDKIDLQFISDFMHNYCRCVMTFINCSLRFTNKSIIITC